MSRDFIIPTTISLGTSLIQAVRIRDLARPVNSSNPYNGKIPLGDVPDRELYKSLLGTPVISNVTFPAGQYTDNFGVVKTWQELRYEAVLFRVTQQKLIVRTQIQGRNGSVKEYIGDDDYVVEMAGVITGGPNTVPYEQVRRLKEMLNAPVAIPVISTFLQNLDIDNLVAEAYEFPQLEGSPNVQIFNVSFLSDMPQELRMQNA